MDDASHLDEKTRQKDHFKDEVFRVSGLPLLRVPVQNTYDVQAIAFQIVKALRPMTDEVLLDDNSQKEDEPGIPQCPNCAGEMVVRTATRGKHQGKQFYVCVNYKECKGVLPAASTES